MPCCRYCIGRALTIVTRGGRYGRPPFIIHKEIHIMMTPPIARDPLADSIDFAVETLRLLVRAARTPAADVQRFIGAATDRSNDLALSLYSHGVDLGVVLEQLRQGLLACRAGLQRPTSNPDTADYLARHRAELDALDRRAAVGDDEAA